MIQPRIISVSSSSVISTVQVSQAVILTTNEGTLLIYHQHQNVLHHNRHVRRVRRGLRRHPPKAIYRASNLSGDTVPSTCALYVQKCASCALRALPTLFLIAKRDNFKKPLLESSSRSRIVSTGTCTISTCSTSDTVCQFYSHTTDYYIIYKAIPFDIRNEFEQQVRLSRCKSTRPRARILLRKSIAKKEQPKEPLQGPSSRSRISSMTDTNSSSKSTADVRSTKDHTILLSPTYLRNTIKCVSGLC